MSTNAIYGFTNAIRQLYNIIGVRNDCVKFIACFDSSSKNHKRSEINPEYKSGRVMPEELKHQFDYCKNVCEALDIPVVIHDEYEADDIIATFAKRYAEEENVVIVTCDKDMFQLIDDNISVYNIIKKTFIHEKQVIEKFGVHPKEMINFQALIGDKCDNIQGIKGIGPKSANVIINAFKKDPGDYTKKEEKLMKKFNDNKEVYERNLQLVTLHTNVDIHVELNPFEISSFKNTKYKNLVTPLGFRV